MKRLVVQRAEAGQKPGPILNDLVLHFNMQPDDPGKLRPKVRNIVHTYRRSTMHDNDYIDEMVKLASQHRFREDMSDTAAFAFGFSTDEMNEPLLGRAELDSPLVIGFATKSTIRRLDHASTFILHLDATFKLNSKSYPVICIGLSDLWRQFHPIFFFLVSDLKQAQWQSAIQATFELYRHVSGHAARIGFVMMDAENAQRSAFEVVALQQLEMDHQPTFLMCFFSRYDKCEEAHSQV